MAARMDDWSARWWEIASASSSADEAPKMSRYSAFALRSFVSGGRPQPAWRSRELKSGRLRT